MKVDINLKKEVDYSYEIEIGDLPNLEIARNRKVAIVSNPKVSGLHISKLLEKLPECELHIITIPDGEKYKNVESVNLILESLFNHQFNRKSLLIGFGGGVVGDITGFTASVYQRGIDFIQVPTTLLSQVDASVGGKTGINNKFGKNLIGAFYQPKAVFINPKFLETLPKREFGAGFAELLKMAVIFDKDFFEYLEKDDFDISTVIKKSVELKAKVVSQDEKEKGVRASLNYGHTFGHIVENETQYSKYLHGEAVAIGMGMANNLALELGFMNADEVERVKNVLIKNSLPTEYQISNIDSFYNKFFLDKKSSDNKIKFILPDGIGNFKIVDDIPEETVKKVLQKSAKIFK
jgi:3-dehydroquinate synthase